MRRFLTAAAAALMVLTPVSAKAAPARTYTNPVSAPFADTFADPTVVRGDDGYWYAYGTTDPLREGERVAHRIPTARSTDLVTWSYVGDAFGPDQLPPYAAANAALWAPDVRRVDGRWLMYVTVTETTVAPGASAIGVATAPTATGPWTFTDQPVVAPRAAPGGGWLWTFDPAQLTDVDGRRYLYYGSYFGGIWVSELTPDGLRITGTATQVGIDNKFEGSWVIRRNGWYYLFASSANCCAGPTTGYSVSVGRSRSPRGPFVDREGQRLDVSRAGGTPVIAPNGNRWIGTGHNGTVTDLAGQDWFVYHAIDRSDPYLDEPFGINERPMLIDRLDWIGGWPTVRAGAWASEGPTAAPVTAAPVLDRFNSFSRRTWRVVDGRWTAVEGVLRGSGTLVARRQVRGDVRVEADVRGGAGLISSTATVRVTGRALTVVIGRRVVARTSLPPGFDPTRWHHLAVEVRGNRLTAELSDARLGDQLAVVSARVRPDSGAAARMRPGAVVSAPVRPGAGVAGQAARHSAGGTVGVVGHGPSEVDNFSAAPLYRPVRRAVAAPNAGPVLPAYSDEFNGTAPGAGWTFVRPDPAVTVAGGELRWPVQGADLTGASNNAGVLLRAAPPGSWIAETRLSVDLGENTVRNYQQAGLIAYLNDDHFARLCAVAIWNTRQVEFGYEIPYAGTTSYGGTIAGTPGAVTTWLRLAHRIDPVNGEHEYRAGVSRDGRTWTWGGVWTLPAGTSPRIGLVAHGGAEPPVTASFDYLRFYRS
jgi:hypothetical protein